MSIRAQIRRWVTDNVVAPDPNPLPSNLDLIGGTYSIVHDALVKGTTVFDGTPLLTPPQLTRAARTITDALDRTLLAALRADMEADPDLAAVYAAMFPVGEVGAVEVMRAGIGVRGDAGRAR